MPPGIIFPYSGSSSPNGYLMCDGSSINRTTYSALFSVIGTTYGNDDSSTFNLPDLRNKFPIGAGSTYSLADTGGDENVTLDNTNLPAHSHSGTTASGSASLHVTDPGHSHLEYCGRDDGNGSNSAGQFPCGDSDTANEVTPPHTGSSTTGISVSDSGHTHTFTTNNTGSGSSFSILNPYIALNYIIKY